MSGKRYITRVGFGVLTKEHEELWRGARPKIVEEVSTAAAHGDRSENAEYIYGKKKLREIDRRIRYLSKLIDRLVIVDPDPEQEGRVFFGARVVIEDENGEESTFRIVGPDEFDLSCGDISVDSPLARALLGKRTDDEVVVRRPKGDTEVTILAISYDFG